MNDAILDARMPGLRNKLMIVAIAVLGDNFGEVGRVYLDPMMQNLVSQVFAQHILRTEIGAVLFSLNDQGLIEGRYDFEKGYTMYHLTRSGKVFAKRLCGDLGLSWAVLDDGLDTFSVSGIVQLADGRYIMRTKGSPDSEHPVRHVHIAFPPTEERQEAKMRRKIWIGLGAREDLTL